MSIDWNNFTPWVSLSGGLLLGLSAAMFVLLNGRILGVSGILGGLLRPRSGDIAWRVALIAGMFAAAWIGGLALPGGLVPAPRIDASFLTLAIAGLLVGLGTRIGSGCTSGHGVCGLSRLSLRSLVSTLGFMGAGFLTVYLVRHQF